MKLSSAKRGFTLIELLVVIAIIGILSSVVLASLGTARAKARDATRISDMKNIQLALELYYDSNQGYPENTTGTAAANLFTAGNGAAMRAALAPTYIPNLPNDPLSATIGDPQEYKYVAIALAVSCATANCGTSYALGATLERPDNPVLDGDQDTVSIAAFRSLGLTGCEDATAGTNGGTELCYSIAP